MFSFGAQPAAAQQATNLFSFGAPAPAAAAPAPAAPSFGGFSFGAPAAAPAAPAPAAFSFAPAPAAPAATGFSFGAAPAPSTASFGFGAPAPTPAAGGFSFGAAAPAPAAAAQPAAPFGFSFGAPAPAPVAGGLLFGQAAAAPATGMGGFGAPAAAQAAPAPAVVDPQDATLGLVAQMLFKYSAVDTGPLFDIGRLCQQYYKADTRSYRFKAIVYNIRDTTAAYLKPALLTSEEWARECAANAFDESCSPPQPLIPVVLDGFDGLAARMNAQDAQASMFLKSAEKLLAAVQSTDMELSRGRDTLDKLRVRHEQIERTLLRVGAMVEKLVMRGTPESAEERLLRERIQATLDALQRGANLHARLLSLAAAQSAREDASRGRGGQADRDAVDLRDPANARSIRHQLETQAAGIEQLLAVLSKDARDLRIIRDTLDEEVAKARRQQL